MSDSWHLALLSLSLFSETLLCNFNAGSPRAHILLLCLLYQHSDLEVLSLRLITLIEGFLFSLGLADLSSLLSHHFLPHTCALTPSAFSLCL